MGRIDPKEFAGGSTPKITHDDFDGDYTILTLTSFEKVDVPDDSVESGTRKSAVLTFEETEDKVLWLNGGMIETLVAQLGDDDEEWIGKQVPVEKYTSRYRGKEYDKVRVMATEEWTKAFKEAGVKRKHPAASSVKDKEPPKAGGVKNKNARGGR